MRARRVSYFDLNRVDEVRGNCARGRWDWSGWVLCGQGADLERLWADTPWPHQIRAPVRVVNLARFHP